MSNIMMCLLRKLILITSTLMCINAHSNDNYSYTNSDGVRVVVVNNLSQPPSDQQSRLISPSKSNGSGSVHSELHVNLACDDIVDADGTDWEDVDIDSECVIIS